MRLYHQEQNMKHIKHSEFQHSNIGNPEVIETAKQIVDSFSHVITHSSYNPIVIFNIKIE